ncbi:MAG TPA: DNA polymerase III subunit gamma and tau [Mycobacteriales bacterium]|nr:DNA polymerase III subunit gamma and tau [Mycobacteriales bacterium]
MSLALYRKYRPGTFAEVVGQEHVTEPLQQALRSGRIHHAYLFSGPRGCGKTSSARILARSLNCEKGPTPEPCGECDSCVALAPNGPGSLDVIEIDAASHGLVDDARDLRERAYFAPVSSRFKIYVIDEAHMVTAQAFNALLKVVEEPPPHVKFIFATTEPEKVLSTIKSRTFHYRFRLIPPTILREFLADLCEREGIKVDPLVLPLVVRAGAGSARDALSVLDQLAAGAGEDGVSYERAVGILGYTGAALLDETVDAFAAADGAAVFRAVDRVIEAGLDPRRFAQDLLERFRDLVVLDAVSDAGETGLIDLPADELDRMRGQAARFGRPGLSRAADVMATALVDMRGTTSPRLVLELACARVLLPGAASDTSALLARLDRLEKRLSVAPGSPPAAAVPATAAAVAAPSPVTAPAPEAPATPPRAPEASAEPTTEASTPATSVAAEQPAADAPAAESGAAAAATPADAPAAAVAVAPGTVDVTALRRLWDDVLDAVKQRNRSAHAMLKEYAQVAAVDARSVTLAFNNAAIGRNFESKSEFFREALREVAGIDLMVKTTTQAVEPAAAAPASVAAPSTAGDPPPPAPEVTPAAADVVDLDADEPLDTDGADADAVSLLQRDLGAQVIGEIDAV